METKEEVSDTPEKGKLKRRPPQTAEVETEEPKKKGTKAAARKAEKESYKNPQAVLAKAAASMIGIMGSMQQEYGDTETAVVTKIAKTEIGVPLPSLAMEYLLQQIIWPLRRVVQLVGMEGCCKSALTFEIARWFISRSSGVAGLLENEDKFSEEWCRSIIGWDKPSGVFGYTPCGSLEDWQSKMQTFIGNMQKSMIGTKESPGPGRIFPVLIILDSLMGKLSEDTIKGIEKTGHAERHFAVEAMKITEFLKKIPADIRDWPMSLIVTNHLKKGKDERGFPVRGKAGGKLISFQETYELEIRKNSNPRILIAAKNGRSEIRGKRLMIECYKNSIGEDGRCIDVDIMWWKEPDPVSGIMRQNTVWDWYGATMKLLTHADWTGGQKKELSSVVDIHRIAKENQPPQIWSDALDIRESDPAPFREAGRILQQNKEVLDGLRKVFGIKPGKRFKTGIDYMAQLKAIRKEISDESEENIRESELYECGTEPDEAGTSSES